MSLNMFVSANFLLIIEETSGTDYWKNTFFSPSLPPHL